MKFMYMNLSYDEQTGLTSFWKIFLVCVNLFLLYNVLVSPIISESITVVVL
jgi:hypothetical protein